MKDNDRYGGYDVFNRGFTYENNYTATSHEYAFKNGKLAIGLGRDFCLDKVFCVGKDFGWGAMASSTARSMNIFSVDIFMLIERAKANVAEKFKSAPDILNNLCVVQ